MELGDAMEALGMDASEEEVGRIMQSMCTSQNGLVDFESFSNVMAPHISGGASRGGEAEQLKQAFEAYDFDQTGIVNAADLGDVFSTLELHLSIPEVDKILKDHGKARASVVTFEEFEAIWNS